MCFRLWPLWLKKLIYYISFYLLVFLIVTAFVRVILWGILYHFGLEFWLFPNYFIDSNDPRDSFLPVYSFEVRSDAADVKSIIFRIASGSLIGYMAYQFCQDEKNIEDLNDLLENGITDLFDYGAEWALGNALGDGKPREGRNTTEEKFETFADKYKKELRKDFDDLIKEDDDEEPTNETAEDTNPDDADDESEPAEDKPELDLEIEEEVSSNDMFDEM